MELKKWNYKGFEIEESLKPGAKKFQYFFRVNEEALYKKRHRKDARKCTYCVWITDDIINQKLNKNSKSEKFEDIIALERETWIKWVKDKIDQSIFTDLAIKISTSGKEEIKLSEISEKVDF
jgi:hypothetical protein